MRDVVGDLIDVELQVAECHVDGLAQVTVLAGQVLLSHPLSGPVVEINDTLHLAGIHHVQGADRVLRGQRFDERPPSSLWTGRPAMRPQHLVADDAAGS